jgi:WhiB family redox-sensing transcriptional regulator
MGTPVFVRAIKWLSQPTPEFPFALCHAPDIDPDLFFPLPADDEQAAEAKAICSNCVHRFACVEYAIANDINDGIFGGFTADERRKLRRRRA